MNDDQENTDRSELRRRAEGQMITQPEDAVEIAGLSTKDMLKMSSLP